MTLNKIKKHKNDIAYEFLHVLRKHPNKKLK